MTNGNSGQFIHRCG